MTKWEVLYLHNIKNGVNYRFFTIYQNKVSHNQFTLIETEKAFFGFNLLLRLILIN